MSRNTQRTTPVDYAIRGKLGGLTNLTRHGHKAVAAPLSAGLSAKLREQAIALGAVTEAEIQERCADLRRLQATKAARARWSKKG